MTKFPAAFFILALLVQPALADDYVPGAPIVKFSDYTHSSGSSGSSSVKTAPVIAPASSSQSSKSMYEPSAKTPKHASGNYKGPTNKYRTTKSSTVTPPASTPSASSASSQPSSYASTSSSSSSSTPVSSTSSSSSSGSGKSMDSDAPKSSENRTEVSAATASEAVPEKTETHRRHSSSSSINTGGLWGRIGRAAATQFLPQAAGVINSIAPTESMGSGGGGGHTTINNYYAAPPSGDSSGGGGSGSSGKGTSSVSGSVMKKPEQVAQISTPVKDKWALVIGVSKFQDPTIPQLRYSAKDARDFADFLIKEQHFAPDHVRVLCDQKATRAQIMAEIGDTFFPRVVQEDDLAVLFYSSHGSPANKDIGGANFLIAYDTQKSNLYSTGIEMQELTRTLRDRAHAKRILIVMDACHSGGGADGAKDAEDGNVNVQKVEMGYGQLLISSSSESERSWESKHAENGVFTKHLIDGLRKGGPKGRLLDVVANISPDINTEVQADFSQTQHVTVNDGKWTGNKLILSAPPAAPRPLPATVKSLLPPDSRGR